MSASSRENIESMFKDGVRGKYKYMIMVCDQFDYCDFPVFVHSKEKAMDKLEEFRHKSMTKIMEVYDLSQDMEKQLNMKRAWMI